MGLLSKAWVNTNADSDILTKETVISILKRGEHTGNEQMTPPYSMRRLESNHISFPLRERTGAEQGQGAIWHLKTRINTCDVTLLFVRTLHGPRVSESIFMHLGVIRSIKIKSFIWYVSINQSCQKARNTVFFKQANAGRKCFLPLWLCSLRLFLSDTVYLSKLKTVFFRSNSDTSTRKSIFAT